MKQLHIFKHALPDSFGGIEAVIETMASGMSDKHTDVTVVAMSKSGKRETHKINAYTVELYPALFSVASMPVSFSYFLAIVRIIRTFDVIFLHFPFPFGDLATIFKSPKSRLFIIYHSDIVRQNWIARMIYEPLRQITFRLSEIIITTSPNYLETSKLLGKIRHKTTVIPLGIDDPTKSDVVKPQISFDFEAPFFLFVGALRYYKGLATLLEASKQTKCNILIVGIGEQERQLTEMIRQEKITSVMLAGTLPNQEKAYCYQKCVGVVFPSDMRSEAFGVTLIEGAAFSKPLISCEIGTGTTYINLDGETGIVIPPNDPDSLANAMKSLLCDLQKAKDIGRSARQRYEAGFTSDLMVRSYRALVSEKR